MLDSLEAADRATELSAGFDIPDRHVEDPPGSAGLFAGVSLEGSYLDADSDWNALYYGQGATTKAIVLDRRYSNPGAEPIRKYLAQW